jgi:hypothetical protein
VVACFDYHQWARAESPVEPDDDGIARTRNRVVFEVGVVRDDVLDLNWRVEVEPLDDTTRDPPCSL